MQLEYIQARDLEHGWMNLELDLPLEPMPDGTSNPFYVERPGNPSEQLQASLLAPFYNPPKLFFSGHRGCGKSTELRRLAVHPGILAKFYPVHFSIRDEADINNLDFQDVLLAIGGRLYREYTTRCGKLPEHLKDDLEKWRGRVEQEITHSSRMGGIEISGGLDAFFATAGLKLKLEPETRRILRQVIQRDVTGLVTVIDKIADAILIQDGRMPLVLIDDLDKPDLKAATEIFHDHREVMLQPNCAIIYTVSSPLFYSPQFEAIRDLAVFLPNVKLHARGEPDKRDREGYETMREFVRRRITNELVTGNALNQAILISGGVFRELARVMRASIRYARRSGRVELDHVHAAESEIRGEYRRLLTVEQRAILRQVRADNMLAAPDRIAPLLQILAVLEYADSEPWWDVHPALIPLLGEIENGNGNSNAKNSGNGQAGANGNGNGFAYAAGNGNGNGNGIHAAAG